MYFFLALVHIEIHTQMRTAYLRKNKCTCTYQEIRTQTHAHTQVCVRFLCVYICKRMCIKYAYMYTNKSIRKRKHTKRVFVTFSQRELHWVNSGTWRDPCKSSRSVSGVVSPSLSSSSSKQRKEVLKVKAF